MQSIPHSVSRPVRKSTLDSFEQGLEQNADNIQRILKQWLASRDSANAWWWHTQLELQLDWKHKTVANYVVALNELEARFEGDPDIQFLIRQRQNELLMIGVWDDD